MNDKSPAFQWYPKDILSSARVAEMTMEEECAYRRLIDFCWLNETIPADPERCARLVGKGCSVDAAKVAQTMFEVDFNDSSKMRHKRLDLEREKQAERRKACAKGGKRSAHKRKQIKAKVDEQSSSVLVATETQLKGNSSSSSSIKKDTNVSKKDAATAAGVSSVFDEWKRLLNHPTAQLDDKRRKRIKARFDEGFSAEQLKTSLRGVLNSPYHLGQNASGTRYDAIETIFRDRAQVEKFIELAVPDIPAAKSDEAAQYLAAEAEWRKSFTSASDRIGGVNVN